MYKSVEIKPPHSENFNILSQALKNKPEEESGFTLIELLVVITIVGILAAAAMPAYSRYRAQAFDTAALTDLRSVAVAEESYFIENHEYFSCANVNCTNYPGISTINKDVTLSVAATGDTFVVTSTHAKGTGKTFTWSSAVSGLVSP